MIEPHQPPSRTPTRAGFTLIELLIVVAIIAILAAIAVPNFLAAQTRSKVSRAMSDMRTLGTAVEAYAVDNNVYPPNRADFNWRLMIAPLSTPVAFITNAHLNDPFGRDYYTGGPDIYHYVHIHNSEPLFTEIFDPVFTAEQLGNLSEQRYSITSVGPDQIGTYFYFLQTLGTHEEAMEAVAEISFVGGDVYDPTNGTISLGDIHYDGKGFRRAGVN